MDKISNDTKTIINKFFSALADKDFDSVMNNFAEQMDWYIPGEECIAPWLGHRRQRYEVKEFFELLSKNAEPVSFNLEHILVDGGFGVATGKFVSKMLQTGVNYSSIFSAHFTVKDNRIIAYRLLEDSNALVKALTHK